MLFFLIRQPSITLTVSKNGISYSFEPNLFFFSFHMNPPSRAIFYVFLEKKKYNITW